MDETPVYDIPFPHGTDAAHGARQLQDMAEDLEVQFNDLFDDWAGLNGPPAWLVRATATTPTLTSGSGDGLGSSVLFSAVDFDNRGFADSGGGALGVSSQWETWYLGTYMALSPATVSGRFQISIRIREIDPFTSVETLQIIRRTGAISNSGGEFVVCDGYVRTRNATATAWAMVDTAEAVSVQIGALFWAMRIGQE